MVFRKTAILVIVLVSLSLSSPPHILAAVNFQASLQSEVISVGFKAVVIGTASPGSRITVTVAGPAAVPPANGTAEASGRFTIQVGPFQAKGTYGLIVQAGTDRKSLVLEVKDQVAEGTVTREAEQYNRALNDACGALQNSLNSMERCIDSFPHNDPGISRSRAAVGRLHQHYQQQVEIITTIIRGNTEFASIAGLPHFRYVWQDIAQFYSHGGAELRRGAQELTAVSDPNAILDTSDMCARALKTKAAFQVAKTLIEVMQDSLREFFGSKCTSLMAGGLTDGTLQGLNRINPAGRGTPLEEQHAIDLAQSFSEVTFTAILHAGRLSPWDLIFEAIDLGVNWGLDYYMDSHCLTFSGKMSGHVHVEALGETGVPYWTQENDWEGDVTLTCAKPETTGPVPVWGIIAGKGKNFQMNNMMSTLYPKTLAFGQFLTTQPSKVRQALAFFCCWLEGTVFDSKISLRLGATKVDRFNGLAGTLTTIIIPFASPVPEVKTYEIEFQNAEWQLSRTFSRAGTEHPITWEFVGREESRRRIIDQLSRELTAQGARGVFTLKIDLCAGCPADWKPGI